MFHKHIWFNFCSKFERIHKDYIV